jgi:hypothetical protein
LRRLQPCARITARAERADTQTRQALHGALHRMGDEIRSTRPDALVVVAAEHFANFFMNNMPAFAIGMAGLLRGPIEDEAFLRIRRTQGARQQGAVAPADRRRDADGRRRLRRGMEVRPRHLGAPALPDAGLRPADRAGQHQLPGPAR